MKKELLSAATIGLVAALDLLIANPAHAVPAFARAHKVECTTCHTIAPELNEYGDAFLKNSYVYIGKNVKTTKKSVLPAPAAQAPAAAVEAAPATAPVVRGEGDADKLSKLKAGAMGAGMTPQPAAEPTPATTAANDATENQAEGMILAGIPEQLPVSFTGSINYFTGDRRNMGTGGNDVDFAARSFKLHAAGELPRQGRFLCHLCSL